MASEHGVLELNGLEELVPFHALWHALLDRTPDATPVRSPDYLRWYWSQFGEGRLLRVLLVPEDGEVTCIFPLSQHVDAKMRCRRVTWAVPELAPLFGPVGRVTVAATKAALLHLKADARRWDLLELSDCWRYEPEDTPALLSANHFASRPHPFDLAVKAVGLSCTRSLVFTGCHWQADLPDVVTADHRADKKRVTGSSLIDQSSVSGLRSVRAARDSFAADAMGGQTGWSEVRSAPTAMILWRVFSPGTLRGRWLKWQHRWTVQSGESRCAARVSNAHDTAVTESTGPAGAVSAATETPDAAARP